MKLPEFSTPLPVQQVGGLDELRGSLLRMGEQQAHAWEQGAQVGQVASNWGVELARQTSLVQVADARAKYAVRKAALDREMSEKATYTKQDLIDRYGSEEAIPEAIRQAAGGLDSQATDSATGEKVTRGKTDIPAWAVQPHIYKEQLDKIAGDAAEGISLPGFKNGFLRAAGEDAGLSNERLKMHKQEEFYSWVNAKMLVNANMLVNSGDLPAALDMVKAMQLDEGKRVALEQHFREAGAKYQLNEPLLAQDITALANVGEALKNGETKFAYTTANGEVKHVDVSALDEQTRRELGNQMRRTGTILSRMEDQEAQKAQKNRDWAFEGTFLDAYTRGNLSGARALLVNPPEGITPGLRKQLVTMMEGAAKPAANQAEKDRANLAVSTLANVFDEAARGDAPSIKDPETGQVIDPKTVDLNDMQRRYKIPLGTYNAMKKTQQRVINNEPVPPTPAVVKEATSYVSRTLGFAPTDKSMTRRGVEASIQLAFQTDLQLAEKQNKGKMTDEQVRQFATDWAANRAAKVTTPGTFWDTTSEDPNHRPLSDVPPSMIPKIQQVRAAYASQYPGLSAGNLDAIWDDHLKPFIGLNGVYDKVWSQNKGSDKG